MIEKGISKEEMLGRVKEALGHSGVGSKPVAPVIPDELVRITSEDENLCELFSSEATKVGMSVQTCSTKDIGQTLLNQLDKVPSNKVVIGVGDRPLTCDLPELVKESGREILDWTQNRSMSVSFQAEVGITDVWLAIAETGTLVLKSSPLQPRALSLAPDAHVAIVRASDILPDMLDLTREMRSLQADVHPSSISLVTGPSKTADIEGILVTGVHGPGALMIILVTDA